VQVLRTLAPVAHPWVDPDVGPMEDAAVLRPPSGAPLVVTVDFITPIVDDPATFGAIAAANALSDVYAMGGEPQAALAICCFPSDVLPRDVLVAIVRGGRDKAAEAGCAIVGGHTVEDAELKYGLCVIGTVAPERVLTQTHARPGDVLVLTKPIGIGVAAQAIKKERLAAADLATVVRVATTLNRGAKDAALASDVRAATDVTGFGFLGHLHNLLAGSGVAARVHADALPLLPFARALVEDGVVPGGTKRNLAYVEPWCTFDAAVAPWQRLLLADAQTSGGLLLAVPPASRDALLAALATHATPAAAVVGEVVGGPAGHIHVAR
jgi:selenide,water dikinase